MKLRLTTDYAIRILLFMAQQEGEVATAETAATKLGITYSYFNKVAWQIKKAGYLESVQGPRGGYRIARNPADITLYDVVHAMEGNICINRCLEDDRFCSRDATSTCPVHGVLATVQNQIVDELQRVTIYDLCQSEAQPKT